MRAVAQKQHQPQQRCPGIGRPLAGGPLLVDRAIHADEGGPLDERVRTDFESRFGHDFSSVRVHTGARAAESARAVNALAYTVEHHIVFAEGTYRPDTPSGRRLLAHELTHVLQQRAGGMAPAPHPILTSTGDGTHRLAIAAVQGCEPEFHEREADRVADEVTRPQSARPIARPTVSSVSPRTLQPFALPTPLPICGALVTDVDVLPARPRPLIECGLPPTVMVTRVNIVGRARGPGSTGRGRIVFNLHVGWYRDPTTGRLCGVISDSMRCLTPGGCINLGCFPTLREVLDAIWEGLKSVLKVLGVVILAILFFLLFRGLRGVPEVSPMGSPLLASGERGREREDEDQA